MDVTDELTPRRMAGPSRCTDRCWRIMLPSYELSPACPVRVTYQVLKEQLESELVGCMLGINKLAGVGSRFKQVSATMCAARVACAEDTAGTVKVRWGLTPYSSFVSYTGNTAPDFLGKRKILSRYCRQFSFLQDGDLKSCGTGTQGAVGGWSPGELLAYCPETSQRRC